MSEEDGRVAVHRDVFAAEDRRFGQGRQEGGTDFIVLDEPGAGGVADEGERAFVHVDLLVNVVREGRPGVSEALLHLFFANRGISYTR